MSHTMTQVDGSIVTQVRLHDGRSLEPIVIPIELVGQLPTLIQAAILQVKANDLLEAKANDAKQ